MNSTNSNLRNTLPYPETPWKISPNLLQRVQNQSKGTYHISVMNEKDPEWIFVHRYFEMHKPANRSIKNIHCILNLGASRQFEGTVQTLEGEADNPVFSPSWQNETDVVLRKKVMNRWQEVTAPYSPFSITWSGHTKESFTKVRILPLWHGTTEKICQSICQSGFTFFGKHTLIKGGTEQNQKNTDIGYFGSGIYFTNSAAMRLKFIAMAIFCSLGWS